MASEWVSESALVLGLQSGLMLELWPAQAYSYSSMSH